MPGSGWVMICILRNEGDFLEKLVGDWVGWKGVGEEMGGARGREGEGRNGVGTEGKAGEGGADPDGRDGWGW